VIGSVYVVTRLAILDAWYHNVVSSPSHSNLRYLSALLALSAHLEEHVLVSSNLFRIVRLSSPHEEAIVGGNTQSG